MLERTFGVLVTLGVLVGLAVTASAQAPTRPQYRYDQKIMADPLTGPAPLKKRLAVARFEDSTLVPDSPFGALDSATQQKFQNDDANASQAAELTAVRNGFTERLVTALFATDRFIIVERRDIHKILREQDFSKSDRVSAVTAPGTGETFSAQYIVTGLITLDHGESTDTTSDSEVEMRIAIPGSRFSTTVGSGRATSNDEGPTEERAAGAPMGDRSLLSEARFDCPRNPRVAARYALHMRVYDVSTSQIVSAVRVSADSQWCLVKAGVQRMISHMEKFPWRTRVTAIDGDRVVVDGGRDVNMSHGYRLAHQTPPARSSGAARGGRQASELEIIEVNDTTSVASPVVNVRNADIRPGDWVVHNQAAAR